MSNSPSWKRFHQTVAAAMGVAIIATAPSRVLGWETPLVRFHATQVHMGTEFTLVFYALDPDHANVTQQAAFQRIAQLDGILSDFDPDSELTRLSRSSPHDDPVPVSEDLWNVLSAADAFSRLSQGGFDVSVGPLTKLWRQARALRRLPAPDRVSAAREAVGFQHIRLVPETRAVQLLRPNMRLDLGGIAKGYAVDQALLVLVDHGITRALVNGGGDMAAAEPPPQQPGWPVALAALDPTAPPDLHVWLRHQAVATSGDAWRFVELDGKRSSHIIDPRTGEGVRDRSNVTVVAPTCTEADALASAISVLGPEAGLQLVEHRQGTAARILVGSPPVEPPVEHTSENFHALLRVHQPAD